MSANSLKPDHKAACWHSYVPEIQRVATLTTYRTVNGILSVGDVYRYEFGTTYDFGGRSQRHVLLIYSEIGGHFTVSMSYFKSLSDCLYYLFERMREKCKMDGTAEILPASDFWLELFKVQFIIKFHLVDSYGQRVKVSCKK